MTNYKVCRKCEVLLVADATLWKRVVSLFYALK